jgi:outer membrane PBP1 activator LpoA protein
MSITFKGLFMRFHRAAGIALLISLALTACVPPAAQRSPEEVAATQRAESLADNGQFDQAIQAYASLADANPANADHYRLLAAETYREEGQLDRASDLLAQIRRQKLTGDEPVRLDLLQAELALSHNDAPTALQLTTQPTLAIPAPLQLRLLELRARAMDGSGDPWGAARTRVEMDDKLSGIDHTQNQREIVALLGKLGVPALRQRASAMQPTDRMLPWINEALAKQGVVVANPQPNLGQPVGTLLPGADASVREGFKMPSQIALLLPAGASYASATASIREGFFAAYADAARTHAPRAAIRLYDSTGTAGGAVKAYQQAVTDGAQLVIGPLTRAEVTALFGQGNLPVPVLALNQPDDKSLPAGNVMEFGLLPETEGTQAADHMIERGLRTAYVIASTEDFAQRAAGAFKAEMLARGGQLAGTTGISPGSVNYASAIASLGAGSASAVAPSAAGTTAGTPAADTGVFISMRPEQARLLLPQLRIAHIALPVFGTSHIYGGVDDAGDDRDLNDVEFCDSPWLFDAQPGLPSHTDIASQLSSARGSAARLFAFGMDAWSLAPYLDWLRGHVGSYLPGATGQLTADQFGRVRRVMVWAKFTDGIARPLSGSLQLDDMPSSAPPGDAPAPAATSAAPAANNGSVGH